jgi:glycosyltransferase involved in cell wall biosynthesis
MNKSNGWKPLRVLLICDSYPPVMGGSEIEAQRVGAAMIRRGHDVHVLCAGGPPMPPVRNWIDPTGVPVSILTRRSRGRWRDFNFAWEVALAIWRRRQKCDVVYFLMQGLHLAAGLPIARVLGKPIVMKIAGSGVIPLMRGSRAGRKELDWMRRWRVPIMVLNEGMIEEALADGFVREQIVWMPNPVDPEEFRPARPGEAEAWRASHGIPEKAQVVVYVGRLSREKGVPGLIGGFARASCRSADVFLLLVGDGPIRGQLEALVREMKINPAQVLFTGMVPAADIPAWLRASDIYSLTSPSEGFPCALLEAMAVGLPSVVSAIPANLQLIDDGVHGVTVPFDDESMIAEALLDLAGDPRRRLEMGRAARQRAVEKYSTSSVIERYEMLFRAMSPGHSHA